VSVDPWPEEYNPGAFPDLHASFTSGARLFDLFQSFCWEHRDRLAIVREPSPSGPVVVYDAGVQVDVVYIDGDHRYDAVFRDLTIASTLFPDAVLCGDDWGLKSEHTKYEGMWRPV